MSSTFQYIVTYLVAHQLVGISLLPLGLPPIDNVLLDTQKGLLALSLPPQLLNQFTKRITCVLEWNTERKNSNFDLES